jgi:hypothetical protein
MKNYSNKILLIITIIISISCAKKEQIIKQQQRQLSSPDCINQLSPSTHDRVQYATQDAELASVEQVNEEASAALIARVCRGWSCERLNGSVLMESAEGGNVRCARAEIPEPAYQRWLGPALLKLEQQTWDAAGRALEQLPAAAQGKQLRVALAPVKDLGFAGGPRASMLHKHMSDALSKRGAQLVTPEDTWHGLSVPRGADALLRAQLRVSRDDAREVEVQWSVQVNGAAPQRLPIYTIAEVLTSPQDPAQARPDFFEQRQQLGLMLHARRPEGGLCAGETAKLTLSVTEDMFVRVIMLDQRDRAIQIYPRDFRESDLVQVGAPLELGEVMGGQGPRRFVAFGAPTAEGLGMFQKGRNVCTIPAETARALHDGRGVPAAAAATIAVEGYRPVQDVSCEPPAPGEIERLVIDDGRIVPCW